MSWHLAYLRYYYLVLTDYKVFITVLFISSSVIVTRLDYPTRMPAFGIREGRQDRI